MRLNRYLFALYFQIIRRKHKKNDSFESAITALHMSVSFQVLAIVSFIQATLMALTGTDYTDTLYILLPLIFIISFIYVPKYCKKNGDEILSAYSETNLVTPIHIIFAISSFIIPFLIFLISLNYVFTGEFISLNRP